MFIDVILVDVMKVPIMQVVNVITVLNSLVTAVRAVGVGVILMNNVRAHCCSLSGHMRTFASIAHTIYSLFSICQGVANATPTR